MSVCFGDLEPLGLFQMMGKTSQLQNALFAICPGNQDGGWL
jgi:hypothetical protein